MEITQFFLALTTGLAGSGHCIGMCGGLVAAFSLTPHGRSGGLPFQLLYHLGRLTTYTLIGAAVGWLGSAIAYTDSFREVSRAVLIGSDLFIIVIGIGTLGAFSSLNIMRFEFPGPTTMFVSASKELRMLPPALSALSLGLLMGLLPCGFLYAVAITAAQSASPQKAALVMLGFGIGTVPALFLFGSATGWLGERARTWLLRLAGLLVALMGIVNLYRHLSMMA